MLSTVAKRIRHDEPLRKFSRRTRRPAPMESSGFLPFMAARDTRPFALLKNTSQNLLQTAGIMLISMLALLAVCGAILLLGR